MNLTMPTTDRNYSDSNSIAKASPKILRKTFSKKTKNETTQETGRKQNYNKVGKYALNLETQNK